jgi:hypothetical protein
VRGGLSLLVRDRDIRRNLTAGLGDDKLHSAAGRRQLARGQHLDHERSRERLANRARLTVTGHLGERDIITAPGRIGQEDVASAAEGADEKHENRPPGWRSELDHKAHADYGVAPDLLRYRVKGGVP